MRGFSRTKVTGKGYGKQLDENRYIEAYPVVDEDEISAYRIKLVNKLNEKDEDLVFCLYDDAALGLIQIISRIYAEKSGFKVVE